MLDESFTALDTESRQSVQEGFRMSVSDLKIPGLVVTHRVADALGLGDRVYLLHKDTKNWEGLPSDMPAEGIPPQK